ncbi:hypothetical protein [Fluviispira sanaruensis]|uniref:Uncharacterized protein n=1 Tax=Fluviispira sanaruensis TaxID=2493639 RepID=A0A4P2VND3_FLUSA|nr:hypothetical protein [Fluviispira sanaruensis]BBH53634.1 hypothetical protein JCM31447_20810 [Fluviispira sanaruensis]
MLIRNNSKILLSNEQESAAVKDSVHAPVSDLANGERIENGMRIKTLPPSVIKDIEQKNIARRLAGLSPIHVRVRRCLTCGSMFESAGNRTCGCSSRAAGTIAGREII